MTALVEDVLRQWDGPVPRLAYITDGGNQQTQYLPPRSQADATSASAGQRLKWNG